MSEQEIILQKPVYIRWTADCEAASNAYPNRIIVWQASFGASPRSKRYDMEFDDPKFSLDRPFVFDTHPFWELERLK